MRENKVRKEILSAFFSFTISLIVAVTVTNNNNFIYGILDKLGWNNDVLRKTTLTLLVTLFMTIARILFNQIEKWVLTKLQPIDFSLNLYEKCHEGNSKLKKVNKKIEYNLVDGEFIAKEFNIQVSLQPKHKWYLHVLKVMKLKLYIYFEPDVLEVQPSGWEDETSSFEISNRKIGVSVFKQANIKGQNFLDGEYTIQEKIIINPIRIKEDISNLDFYFSTEKCRFLSFIFTKKINLTQKYVVIVNEGGE